MARTRGQVAEEIVDTILKELAGREGLSHQWDSIDEETQKEIRDVWVEIVLGII